MSSPGGGRRLESFRRQHLGKLRPQPKRKFYCLQQSCLWGDVKYTGTQRYLLSGTHIQRVDTLHGLYCLVSFLAMFYVRGRQWGAADQHTLSLPELGVMLAQFRAPQLLLQVLS